MKAVFHHPDYEIEYLVYGSGENIVIAFHGYNNHAGHFSDLPSVLGPGFTIVSVNLFFHGGSHTSDALVERGLRHSDVKEIFQLFTGKFPAQQYTLFAFSLGGRIALKILELFPEKIERIILLAPDGLRISPLYWSLTQNPAGRAILKRFVTNPSLFFKTTDWLQRTGKVSASKLSFALYHFDSEWKRERVYKVWLVLRRIHSKQSVLRNIIRKHSIRVDLFFGSYDRIIPVSAGLKFAKGLEKFIRVTVLESGHRLLTTENLKKIRERLRQ